MSEFKITFDAEDFFDLDRDSLQDVLTDQLRSEIIKEVSKKTSQEDFQRFSESASDSIVAGTKMKMENFLSEQIALTDRYGKAVFICSIEDLMKKRFDEVLLRGVDSNGKTIEGCTTHKETWIEWNINKRLTEEIQKLKDSSRNLILEQIKTAQRNIENFIEETLEEKKQEAIKKCIKL